MSTKYDSTKIRALARQISRAADQVSSVNHNNLRGVANEVPTNFCGQAADALQESVNELMADVSSVSAQLRMVSRALMELAARVEYADRQARGIISSR